MSKREPVDPQSDAARLRAHRKLHSMYPNGRPESNVERQLRAALDHLDKVLNPSTYRESVEAEGKAREFLRECGR